MGYIGAFFVAAFFGACILVFSLFWVENWAGIFRNYYEREKAACEVFLQKSHRELPRSLAPFFYFCGPLAGIVVSVVVLPWISLKIAFSLILSLFLFKSGRKLAAFLYNRRLNKIKEQLMDAMGLVANALRSGLSLAQALEMVAQEMPGAIAEEFGQVISETRVGSTLEEALDHFRKRIPLPEVVSMVDSIQILRETGGNLVETFEILIHTLREEQRVQGKIKTMTTQGIAQAVVITALPFGMAAALYFIAPDYLMPLFDHWLGWIIIALMLLLQGAGLYVMMKMVKIEI